MGIKDRIQKALGRKGKATPPEKDSVSDQGEQSPPSLKDLLDAYDAKEGERDKEAYNLAQDALEAGKGDEITNNQLLRLVRYSQQEAERGENE